ncbi:DUF6246 family protein [Lonsdalea quercina]|uniref:DUF6246 family protein n=1 Tax=Lonsdalea quercina TaxID=71657 RepID=UPI00397483FF
MTPHKEIGECLISSGDRDYFFRPSLAAMTNIGTPKEIVQTFYTLHHDELNTLMDRVMRTYRVVPPCITKYIARPQLAKPLLYASMDVLQACCDEDIAPLVGEIIPSRTGKWGFVYRPGKLSFNDMLVTARSLITHGIIGKAKVRRLQKNESRETTTEFNAFEYITSARIHLGISREEAERLTMTEFQLLIAAKYPEQKGFTREEYDAVADDYFAKRERRISKAKN